ncbi:MAG: hypothetical protein ACRYFS_14200 [Janthinobacterium lividum]
MNSEAQKFPVSRRHKKNSDCSIFRPLDGGHFRATEFIPWRIYEITIMGMFSNIYIDANLDLRELALYLLPEMQIATEITLVHPDGKSLQYRFLAEGGRPMVYLSENPRVYHNESDTSSYRYELSAIRGAHIPYLQAIYESLLRHECFSLAYQKFEGLTDLTHQPLDYNPDYSLITRLMPVELLLWTNMTKRRLLRELRQCTNQNFSGDAFYDDHSAKGAGGYLEKISLSVRTMTSRYSETDASYYIRIFGSDDNPSLRRTERDALARAMLIAVQQKLGVPVQIFEVINCQFVPFA